MIVMIAIFPHSFELKHQLTVHKHSVQHFFYANQLNEVNSKVGKFIVIYFKQKHPIVIIGAVKDALINLFGCVFHTFFSKLKKITIIYSRLSNKSIGTLSCKLLPRSLISAVWVSIGFDKLRHLHWVVKVCMNIYYKHRINEEAQTKANLKNKRIQNRFVDSLSGMDTIIVFSIDRSKIKMIQ